MSASDVTNASVSNVSKEADTTGEPGPSADGTDTIRSAVRAEFDEVVPHVIEALRRNNAFDEINARLRTAERRIAARQERPVIIGVHRVLDRIRHLEFDQTVRQALDDDLVRVLAEAGYEETGRVGEPYDLARHDAIAGRAANGEAVVTTVHARGLASFGDVVIRAKVAISPARLPQVADNTNLRS